MIRHVSDNKSILSVLSCIEMKKISVEAYHDRLKTQML